VGEAVEIEVEEPVCDAFEVGGGPILVTWDMYMASYPRMSLSRFGA
jgi:hypothetical protein